MIVRELTIKNKKGLHARPAATVSQVAKKFESDIVFEAKGYKFNAKSIMEIIMLSVGRGEIIKIYAEGKDEERAVEAISDLLENEQLLEA